MHVMYAAAAIASTIWPGRASGKFHHHCDTSRPAVNDARGKVEASYLRLLIEHHKPGDSAAQDSCQTARSPELPFGRRAVGTRDSATIEDDASRQHEQHQQEDGEPHWRRYAPSEAGGETRRRRERRPSITADAAEKGACSGAALQVEAVRVDGAR